MKISGNDGLEHRFPPKLGEDTRDILAAELELPVSEIEALARAGVIKLGATGGG